MATSIFLQRMKNHHEKANEPPIRIMSWSKDEKASARADKIGGFLIEGMRITYHREKIQTPDGQTRWRSYFVGTPSCSTFCSDAYTLSFAASENLTDPASWRFMRTPDGGVDWGKVFKEKFNQSWVGRAAIYRNPWGELEFLYHYVDKSHIPEITPEKRAELLARANRLRLDVGKRITEAKGKILTDFEEKNLQRLLSKYYDVLYEIAHHNDYSMWPESQELWAFFRHVGKVKKLSIDQRSNGTFVPVFDPGEPVRAGSGLTPSTQIHADPADPNTLKLRGDPQPSHSTALEKSRGASK